MNTRETIESAIETSPQENPPPESLAMLIERLGEPPPDVVDAWCDQFARGSTHPPRRSGERLSDPPLSGHSMSGIDLHQWTLTFGGELKALPSLSRSSMPLSLKPLSLKPLSSSQPISLSTKLSTTSDEMPPHASRRARRPIGRWLTWRAAGMLSILVAVLIGAAVFSTSSRSPEPPLASTRVTPAATDSKSLVPVPIPIPIPTTTPAASSPTEALPPKQAESPALQRLDLLIDDDPPAPDRADVDSAMSLSLDELLSPIDSTKPVVDTIDEAIGKQESPPESSQQTRTAKTMAVELPKIGAEPSGIELDLASLADTRLEFPIDVPLSLQGDPEAGWEIRDTRQDSTVATLQRNSDAVRFEWLPFSIQSPAASRLFHGRITSSDGSVLYLRPVIEANPWPIRLDDHDVMPTWNLREPIPPQVTRLSIELNLPEEIEQGWIEPIDLTAVRRTRGLAVLSPKDGETVAIGLRFDIRCSRKISCRIRFAARLDPSLPWQLLSSSGLDQFANQLASQAMLVSNEEARLDAVYEMAGTSGRRLLRVKQKRNDAAAKAIQTASQRVVELQGLIATIETEGKLELRVWVEWPDGRQELLIMPPDDSAENPGDE